MPEVARFELSAADMNMASRKASNMSNSSEDSLRKISNDSGISIASSRSIPSSVMASTQFEELLGEPRLSSDLSNVVLQNMLAQQQSITAAAALNPAMFGLMSAGLWGNPLAAAAMLQQQQEATARKLLESSVKAPHLGTGKQYSKEPFPVYPGLSGLMHPSSQNDQMALSEALRNQLISRKLSEDIPSDLNASVKPTRKAHSFNGSSSSPLNRQLSPPTSSAASPNLNNGTSPNRNSLSNHEQQSSLYGDDDSICSGKSSVRSRTPQPLSQADNQSIYNNDVSALPPAQHYPHIPHPSNRKRKNGIIGSMPIPDLSAYAVSHPAFPTQSVDIPMHKLSTASLPASLPSANHRSSVIGDTLGRGSPATSRKRQRNLPTEEKIGYPQEDDSYWERRRKNNEAAKRSRDSRRAKEDEIAIRAAFLEQENLRLRVELNQLKDEFSKLQTELDTYKKPSGGDKSHDIENEEPVNGVNNEEKPQTESSFPAPNDAPTNNPTAPSS